MMSAFCASVASSSSNSASFLDFANSNFSDSFCASLSSICFWNSSLIFCIASNLWSSLFSSALACASFSACSAFLSAFASRKFVVISAGSVFCFFNLDASSSINLACSCASSSLSALVDLPRAFSAFFASNLNLAASISFLVISSSILPASFNAAKDEEAQVQLILLVVVLPHPYLL